ncbi:MAG: peptidylprolyl isomerase [Tissierellia bacterium]|nr:peptidylprolyl isomerase [Tissierellia bacterium]
MKQLDKPIKGDKIAIMKTTLGEIKIKLFPEAAPLAVENFEKLSEKGYYDGVIFHRVIPDFMIQGGDPTGTGRGGESIFGRPFDDEFDVNFRNYRGALSMANSGPDTNGSQFFIVQISDTPKDGIVQMREAGEKMGYPDEVIENYENIGGAYWLDFRHTVFGQVYEGMDVVDSISAVNRDTMDKPVADISIESIEIREFEG